MSTSSDRRIAVITGCAGGIGSETAARFAAEGYDMMICDIAEAAPALNRVAEAARSAGSRVQELTVDVSDERSVASLFDKAHRSYGGIDVVVHAAGVMTLVPLAEMPLEVFDNTYRVNVRGTFLVSQQAVRRLRRGGSLVNFSSSVVPLGLPTYAAYAASKGAIEALTPVLVKELRGRDVTVNAVAPGPTATAMFFNGRPQANIDRAAALSPLERLGEPGDIADVIAFLSSPRGHWINGQVVRVNGGTV
jgi:3-oxoacyl-[acyl-carrier protein] reductase